MHQQSYAQLIISGNVKNNTNQPIEYVAVTLFQDTLFIAGTYSDSLGHFSFNVNNTEEYRLIFSQIGYDSLEQKIVLSANTELSIILTAHHKELQAITVTEKRPLVEKKPDKLIFNVSNSTLLIGANTMDILRKTPLVNISSSNQISLLGKDEVKVMINNKLIQLHGDDLINYLKSIPSNSISKIEVITNPSAQFDAAGNSGILNIITTKPTKEEWSGTLQAIYEQTFYATGEVGASISHSTKKWNWVANLSYKNGKRRPVEKMNADYGAQQWNQITYRKKNENRFASQIGIDYIINKNSTLSMNYTGIVNRPHEPATGETIIYNNTTNKTDSSFITTNTIKERIHLHAVNVIYTCSLNSNGDALTINSDFFSYQNRKTQELYSENFFPNGISTNQKINDQSIAPQKITIHTTAIDYKYPFRKFTFNMGSKFSYIHIDNDFVYLKNLVNDLTKSNHFIYKEITPAAYFSTSFTVKKFDFQFGLRGEHTQLEGKSITLHTVNPNSYFKLFPTIFTQYTINDNHVLSLSYGRRINRPGYWELNPFRYYLNMYQYAEGNPYLSPSLSNNTEGSYTFHKKYILSIFYDFFSNQFQQIPFIDSSSNAINFTRQNIGNTSSKGIYVFIPINFTKWWESTNTVTGFIRSQHAQYFQENIDYTLPSFSFSTNHQFIFTKNKMFVGELNFYYLAPSRNLIYKISDYCLVDIGLKYILMNSKLTVGINAEDLFYTGNPTINSVEGIIQPIAFFNKNDNRLIRLSCVYTFGNNSTKKKRNTLNKEEINRIK